MRELNIAGGRIANARTDSAGKYNFAGLQPSEYRFSVSSAGFATATQDLTLVPGGVVDTATVKAAEGTSAPRRRFGRP